jgi:hypothetical protein
MEAKATSRSSALPVLILALSVLALCLGLFGLDSEIKSITDLFKPGNLFALAIYFLPTFIACYFLFRKLNKNALCETACSPVIWRTLSASHRS